MLINVNLYLIKYNLLLNIIVFRSFPEFREPGVFKLLFCCFPAWVPDGVKACDIVDVHGLLPEEPGGIVSVVFATVRTGELVCNRTLVVISIKDELPFLHLQDCPAIVTGDLEDFFLTCIDKFFISWFNDYHMFFLVYMFICYNTRLK